MGKNTEKQGVSAWLTAYNHAEYIEDCLLGMINQRVDFPYEILVHDDASNDGTTEIIKRYANEYPELVKPIIQTENQYRKPGNVMRKQLLEHTAGKYIAGCEGDDVWTDSSKIRKQYKWMEAHPECSMCAHASVVQFMDTGVTRPFSSFYREEPTLLDIETIAREGEIIHTSSLFYRVDIAEDHNDFFNKHRVHDFGARLFYATQGYVGYLPDVMSLYRKGTKDSWTDSMKDPEYRKKYNEYAVDILKKLDEYTCHQYTEYIMMEIERRTQIN